MSVQFIFSSKSIPDIIFLKYLCLEIFAVYIYDNCSVCLFCKKHCCYSD